MDDDSYYFNFDGVTGFVEDNKITIRYIDNVLDNNYLLLF